MEGDIFSSSPRTLFKADRYPVLGRNQSNSSVLSNVSPKRECGAKITAAPFWGQTILEI